MYDRKFWKVFVDRFGRGFSSTNHKLLTIYFNGYNQDSVSTETAEEVQIEILEEIDFLILTTKVREENIRIKDFLLHFEDIEEVQFEETIVLDEKD